MSLTALDIVLINWNAGPYLRGCLQSIAEAETQSFVLGKVVVVDNASQDDSMNGIERIRLPIEILRNDRNEGFSAACNQAARVSTSDYILFLNPDTRLFRDSLEVPVRFMEHPDHASVGIVGIQLKDEQGRTQRTCARFPTAGTMFSSMLGLDRLFPRYFPGHFMREWDHQQSRSVDQVMGSFFLVRRSLFKTLGGFDERYFLYYEELDFSLCARLAGYTSFYLAEARAFHRGGGSSEQVRPVRLFYFLRSRLQYCNKHFRKFTATAITIGTLVVEPVVRLLFAVLSRSPRGIVETSKSYARLWRAAPRLMESSGRRRP